MYVPQTNPLQNPFDRIEYQLHKLIKEIENMAETSAQAFADLKAQNDTLAADVATLQNVMDTIKGDVASLLQKISEGTVSVSDIEAELTKVKATTDKVTGITTEGQQIDQSVNAPGSSNFGEVPQS